MSRSCVNRTGRRCGLRAYYPSRNWDSNKKNKDKLKKRIQKKVKAKS